MSPIRVLLFTESFVGLNYPGVQAQLFEECIKLSSKIKFTVVAENITSESIENVSLVKVSKILLPIFQTLYRTFVYTCATITNRKKYNIVFIRYLTLGWLIAGIIAKRFLKKKLVVWLGASRRHDRGIRGKFYRPFLHQALTIADAIVAASENVIKDVESYHGEVDRTKVSIIKQAVDSSRFRPLNNYNNDNLLLSVARIHPDKGIEDIIRSLPYIIDKISNIKLMLVGPFDNENYLKSLKELASELHSEKYVQFVGPVPKNELTNWYNSSKIFILTSKTEGQSNVTLEAMACGKPVIATPVGAIPELIEDGITGLIVKNNQPKLLAEKIIMLLKDGDYREKLGKSARKKIEEKHTWDLYVNAVTNLFNKV